MPRSRRLALTIAAVAGVSAPGRVPAQAAPDTLPGYERVRPGSDSAALVRAADDALRGAMSMPVPLAVTRFRRERGSALIAMRPAPPPNTTPVVWHGLAGTVRVLPDGRRVIVSRD